MGTTDAELLIPSILGRVTLFEYSCGGGGGWMSYLGGMPELFPREYWG